MLAGFMDAARSRDERRNRKCLAKMEVALEEKLG